ncbi:unnamed protein product [Chironomus riparius]|uniref:Aminopeptidase n=1 Tax=Chironomus riparius TaxID=315576 RepID=A0A9N9RZD8_9DIPT|nr:unnamed protein product [Chironomus riparius]
MEKLKIFVVFSALVQLSLETPLNADLLQSKKDDRIENKNWKLKNGLYWYEQHNPLAFNDPPTTYRLPNNTLPVRYDIFLKTDVDKHDFNFYGQVRIQIRAMETTDTVTLQYRDMNVTKVTFLDMNGQVVEHDVPFEYVEPRYYEFLRISLPRIMTVDEKFVLEISYSGILNERQFGFYRASYTERDTEIYYAVTQFEATDARHAFPCYDEPGIRTPFGLEIQHDKSYNAYSNMKIASNITLEGTDYVVTKFEDTPLMQTYLLAFLVAPFEEVSNNNTQLPQKIIAKPSSIRNAEYAFSLPKLDPIMKALENLFAVNFTLSKLDHAAITQFAAGAMENWGLVTYREIALLFVPSEYPETDEFLQRRIITIIAHEDAHQYFGNLVSPHWWTDLWLNEGLATLYEYYIAHLVFPEWDFMQWFREREVYECFKIDISTAATSVPMSRYVEAPKDIDDKFDDISYGKGGVVMRMFQEAFTVSTFTKGLSKYLTEMSYKAAVPDDLFSSLQDAFKEDNPELVFDVAEHMGSWIYQAGYPLVRVSRSGNLLQFKQQRYMSGDEIYSIPLTYASKSQPDFNRTDARIWFTQKEIQVPQTLFGSAIDEWVIFNVQQVGYYRMSYSSELWYRIAKGLRHDLDKIHRINREVLVDELNIGYYILDELLASDVLEVLLYLDNEEHSEVWNRADLLLFTITEKLFATAVYEDYLKYLQFITRPQLERLGYEELAGDDHDTRLLRMILKTHNCHSLDDFCLSHESKKLELYMQNNQNPTPNFCLAFRTATLTTYIHYLNEITSNPDLYNRYSIVNGIACSLDKSHLQLLTVIIEDEKNDLENFERVMMIEYMLTSSIVGLEVGFDYLERNLNKISNFVVAIKEAINTQEYSEKLDALLDAALDESFISTEDAEEIRDAIKLNLEWQDKHFEAVREWIEDLDDKINETTEKPTTTIPSTTPDSATGMIASIVLILVSGTLIRFFV